MSRAARLVLMMVRPPVAVVVLLFAAIGVAQGGEGDALHPILTVLPLIVGGWFVHATVLNDLGDEAIDRVNLTNARGRPLVSGHATRAELRSLGRAAAAVALLAALTAGWPVALVVAGGLALSAAYSVPPLRLCQRGAVASLLLPAGYVAVPYLAGLLSVQPSVGGDDLVLLLALYVTFIGRIMLKDFRDAEGDALYGKRTFLVRHGRRATCAASAACWTAGVALFALLPWRGLLPASFAALLACALHGLRRLADTGDRVAQQVVIGAIAQAGRGMGIVLLAHLTMTTKGWSIDVQATVVAAVTVLFAGLYKATLREPVAELRPW